MNLYDLIGSRRSPTKAAILATNAARSGAGPIDARATRDLRDALEILADQMHDAVSRRRMSQPGSESFRRADERVAHVLELFDELRRGAAIPDEIWRLPFRPPG